MGLAPGAVLGKFHAPISNIQPPPRWRALAGRDLGSRTTKAVHVQRRGDNFALCGYALLDAPIFEKALSADLLSEHLKAVSQALDTKSKLLTLTVGVNEAIVRHTEMPRMPL